MGDHAAFHADALAQTLAEDFLALHIDQLVLQAGSCLLYTSVKAHLLNGCPTSHYKAADGRYRVYEESGAFLGLAGVEDGLSLIHICLRVPSAPRSLASTSKLVQPAGLSTGRMPFGVCIAGFLFCC